MRKTGTKWKTERCGSCGEPHSGYSGKLNADDEEYVVCGDTHKVVIVNSDIRKHYPHFVKE